MTMTVEKFRREAARRRERGTPRYPAAMRAFAVAHARSVRSSGGSVRRAALELGISNVSLHGWLRKMRAPTRLREVQVTPSPAASEPARPPQASTVVVTAPSGHVVSGLSVEQAAELLRALS